MLVLSPVALVGDCEQRCHMCKVHRKSRHGVSTYITGCFMSFMHACGCSNTSSSFVPFVGSTWMAELSAVALIALNSYHVRLNSKVSVFMCFHVFSSPC